jgi:hypothetical protein
MAALGVVLSGCTATKTVEVPPPAPLPVITSEPAIVPVAVAPGPWRIRKTAWTDADEKGFGQFVRAIAESGCTTTILCMQTGANPYHDSDPPEFLFHADCAKWAYMLRAYYASKNGLPFSYVSKISFDGDEPRFTTTSNHVVERRDLIDTGTGIDADAALQLLHDEVSTATYRMDPASPAAALQDFYSPKIQPNSIRPGTAIYDTNAHVMIVYDITADGSILYMDASPDQSVTRGAFGPHIARSPEVLGGGFKNFRPQELVGAQLMPDGTYLGGHIVLKANDAIPDFSLEQYEGNIPDAKPDAQFRYNNASLNLYEYARASMSSGGFDFNPVYELEVSMGSLCQDATDQTKEANARVERGLATLHADLLKQVASWQRRDLRVVYHGLSLKDALAETYAEQEQACVAARSGEPKAMNALDRFVQRTRDVQRLIAQINEPAPLTQMQPVGN